MPYVLSEAASPNTLLSHKTPPNSAHWPLQVSPVMTVNQLTLSHSLEFSWLIEVESRREEGTGGQMVWTKHILVYFLSHRIFTIVT